MAKITLPITTWVCVNAGAAYASGVEVTINVEKTTANLRYEFKDSDTVAPTPISDITEAVQSLSVKAVDGKGFLWLISQGVNVDVQVETITPATADISIPSNLAKEEKQDDQIAELQAIKDRIPTKGQDVAANSLPVVLPVEQITAITPPTSISVDNFPETQPISVDSLPLPSNASTLTEQQTQTSAQQRIRDAIEKTVATGAGKTPVIGDFSPAVPPDIFQPISSDAFEPIAGRDFNIQVIFGAGVTGNVQLEQSLDGTNFYQPTGSGVAIMRFSSNAVEQWSNSEVGAKFRLRCTAIDGGTINYRISQ